MQRMVKRILSATLSAALFCSTCFPIQARALSGQDLSAKSAVVIEQKTKRVLFEKNAYEKLPMASTTKIMTGILALEKGNPEDIVTVSAQAAGVEGSSLYLKQGEKIRLIDLVYGLMLNSGNDAAVAVAQHISGSVEEFVALMNKKAEAIGAVNTHFENPNGLSQEGHYTTAYDLALITAYALSNPEFAKVVSTKKYTSNNENNSSVKVFANHNKLLSMYEGCDGVKTGFTRDSGRTLVSSATKNGFQAVCVTLNAPNDWQDHTAMFNDVFARFAPSKLVEQGAVLKTVPVKNGDKSEVRLLCKEEFSYPVFADELSQISYVYHVEDTLTAPVYTENPVGTVDIYYKKQLIKTLDLYADDLVVKVESKAGVGEIFSRFANYWLMIFAHSDIIN